MAPTRFWHTLSQRGLRLIQSRLKSFNPPDRLAELSKKSSILNSIKEARIPDALRWQDSQGYKCAVSTAACKYEVKEIRKKMAYNPNSLGGLNPWCPCYAAILFPPGATLEPPVVLLTMDDIDLYLHRLWRSIARRDGQRLGRMTTSSGIFSRCAMQHPVQDHSDLKISSR